MNPPACARCGQPITPGARFCTRCGSDVSGEQGNVATARLPSVPAEEAGIEILRRATLGEYEILAELGRGGMATVYLAHEISLDRKVAIKVMAPQLMFGEGMAERFRREARTAASLSHPHIIPIFAVKESGRVLYFVMKFVAGRPLDDIIREVGPLPIPMVRAILSQVGSALGYAHRRGIIHRDIKPANIMIDDEGWAVVTDFGIAKVAETQGLTMTGVAVGTPSYMSPEQCAAKEVTGRSDQYSLGIVAYEMITGKQPFVADTAMAIMWQHFNDPPRPLRDLRAECPPELEAAVLRMMEKQPDARWTSIEDAMGALGTSPLAHDDPIRIRMVGLAKSSLNQRLLDEMKTPTSLVPPTRGSNKQATEMIAGVGSVALSPRSANLAAGDTLQLSVLVQDLKGNTIAGRTVTWASADAGLATVSATGLVSALAPGDVVITGSCEGQSATCQLTIAPVPVAAVVVAPASGSIETGETLQLSATLRDAQGRAIDGRSISWTSSAPALAGVSADGLVAGSLPGAVKITATAEGKSGVSSLTVVAAPVATLTLNPDTISLLVGGQGEIAAIIKDRRGAVVAGRQLAWTSRHPAVATVSDAGVVRAIAAGSAEVIATCEGKSATLKVNVSPVPVARIEITQPPKSIEIGESRQLAAIVRAAGGDPLERPVSWRSADPATLAVSPSGEVTGLKAGGVEVVASADQQQATVQISVVPVPVAAVVLSPANVGIKAGESAQLSVQARDTRGKPLEGRAVTWSSSKPAVASVSHSGLVTALAAGNTIVTALVEGKKATADVRIAPAVARAVEPAEAPTQKSAPPVAQPVKTTEAATEKMKSVAVEPAVVEPARPTEPARQPVVGKRSRAPLIIGALVLLAVALGVWRFGPWAKSGPAGPATSVAASPASPVLNLGDSVHMSAVFHDSANRETSAGPAVTWTSDNPAVAVVSGDWVRAIGGGTATILASAAGLQGSAVVTVKGATAGDHIAVGSVSLGHLPPTLTTGETIQLSAEVKDGQGGVLAGRPVSWVSSNPAVAVVTPSGQVTGKGEGSVTLTATSEGKSATATMTVAAASVASVQVTPSRSSLEVNGTVGLTAQARDAKGNVLDGRSVAWTSSNPAVASVGNDGTVKAVAVGSATITAAADGKSGTAAVSVVVTRVDVVAVSISPNGGAMESGERLQLQAELKDGRGAAVRDRTPEWSSSDPDVATVSPSGLVTAVGPGNATISAASDDKQASVRVTVAKVAIASLAVTSPPPTLPVGESFQLTPSVRDGRGNLLGDRAVSWSSSNVQVATVSPSGLVSAVGPGNARITATSEGKSVSATITVPRPVAQVAGVAVAPSSLTLEPGATMQLAATPQDARGSAMDRPVAWTTANAAVATVSRTGLVTAGSPGSTAITATSDTRSATVPVTVVPRAATDVVTPPPANTGAGGAIPRGSIAAGGAFSCGVLSGGGLACWGAGIQRPTMLSAGARFTRISAGTAHACGLTSSGEAWCWGNNAKGQVGDNSTNNTRATPVAVVGGLSFRLIRAGGKHTCGLTSAGKAYCWGDNGSGQLGDGTTSGRTRPVPVPDLTFTDLAAGGSHTCGIATTGKTYCWGDGFSGQLGYGQLSTESSPVEIDGAVKFTRIYAGGTHTCGLTAANKAYCWGDNRASQLGDGSRRDRPRPVEVIGGATFEELSLGASHTCGRTSGGQVDCWGSNAKGQLGDGSRGNRDRPVKIQAEGPFISVSAGGTHTCAATASAAYCWGDNARGQLGDGSLVAKPTPVAIAGVGN